MISAEVKAAQEAYAARPFAVRWEDSHSALTNRFHTFDEAFSYMLHMANVVASEQAKRIPYFCTSFGRSFLETPKGRVQLSYYLLADDVRRAS